MRHAQSDSSNPFKETVRQRLFFALWPGDSLRSRLATLARRSGRKRGKLVAPENLHITLAFLGAVSSEGRLCAERAAGTIHLPSFTLTLDRIGHWPRPRVMWSGPSQTPAALIGLVRALQKGLATCGFEPERRPYRAHVCLARKVSGRLPSVPHAPLEWHVQNFHLVESKTHSDGARYTVLASWPLDGAVQRDDGAA